MDGRICIVLHAHLPFVRHPQHEKFLEENWLFEAVTETYIPLLRLSGNWEREGLKSGLTLTLSPTLCTMLQDSLLQERYVRHLKGLVELAGNELLRTYWEKSFQNLASFYYERLTSTLDFFEAAGR